jgi:hypothetical protein
LGEGANDPFEIIKRLYHFTDRRNLDSIREHGALMSLEMLEAAKVKVEAPGGDAASQATDKSKGMDRFVHLCLHQNHPMAYVAKRSGRLGDLIYLEIERSVLYEDGVRFVPGMANTTGIEDYALTDAASQGMLVDVETLNSRIPWNIFPEARERRVRAEKFEILVPGFIPLDRILNMPNG